MASAGTEHSCFVGSLARATTGSSLDEAFSEFGEILDSRIIKDPETGRSRGFGFVTYKEEKSQRAAIKGMNGKMLDGRNITVKQAKSRSGGARHVVGGGNDGGGYGPYGYGESGGGGYGYGRREGVGGGLSEGIGGGYGGDRRDGGGGGGYGYGYGRREGVGGGLRGGSGGGGYGGDRREGEVGGGYSRREGSGDYGGVGDRYFSGDGYSEGKCFFFNHVVSRD